MRKNIVFVLTFCFLTFIKASNPGYLGIMINDYSANAIQGALVVNIFDDGAAKQYGLKENDIITSINGVVVQKRSDLTNQLAAYNWGDAVSIDYIRNGKNGSTTVYLGYKGTQKTYNVFKKVKPDGEYWNFTDDKTVVLVKEDNTPVSISKTNDNGVVDTWMVGSSYKQEEVPQYFLDIDDKVFCIKRIKEDQARRNCKINDIIYIKELKDTKQDLPAKIELLPELFSIFPNPSNGQFSVKFSSNEKGTPQLLIFDITGKIVQTDIIQNFTGEFTKSYNLENVAKGAYLIQLKIGDKLTSKKILIQ